MIAPHPCNSLEGQLRGTRFRNVLTLGNAFNYLQPNVMIRFLLRALGGQAGRIWEGSLEEVTCVLTMGGIGRVIERERSSSMWGWHERQDFRALEGGDGGVEPSHYSLGFIPK